jgi:general secretion pathway protein C
MLRVNALEGWPVEMTAVLEKLKALAGGTAGVSAAAAERLSRRLAAAVFLLAVVLVAYELAALTWALVPATPVAAPGPATGGSEAPSPTALDVTPVLRAHLFGEAGGSTIPTPQVVDAPDTKLNLELHGVFFSPETKEARAIIASARGDDRAYGVGDAVPGGATIEEVQVERVLLRRAGRLEVLRLPKDEEGLAQAGPDSRAGTNRLGERASTETRRVDYRSNRQLARTLGRYREQVKANPERLADLARVEVAMEDGEFQGYRLMAGKDARLLNRFGLRTGDVLVGVNGLSLDAPEKGLEALQALSDAEELDVEVLRAGNRLSFSFRVEP